MAKRESATQLRILPDGLLQIPKLTLTNNRTMKITTKKKNFSA